MIFNNKEKKVTVQEIHDTFNTEVERLLKEANNLINIPKISDELEDKATRLKNLGFVSTKPTTTYQSIKDGLEKRERENNEKMRLAKAIGYFSEKYPLYKFITEDSVRIVCKQYGLIYGTVERFKGDVPEKNLKEIESAKIDINDISFHDIYYPDGFKSYSDAVSQLKSKSAIYSIPSDMEETLKERHHRSFFLYNIREEVMAGRKPLIIAAPKKDFDTDGMKLDKYQLKAIPKVKEDPIVMQPVHYDGQEYFLILSAWGEEASNEKVINHIQN